MKQLLASLLISVSTLSASGPGTPPTAKGLKEILELADVVVIGTPTKSNQRHFYKGNEVTEKEAREIYNSYNSDSGEPFPRLTTEFTVTLWVSQHLKGAVRNPEIVFQWKDLTGSMCPHIPLVALKEKGIWYTGQHVRKHEHDHAIYWMGLTNQKQIESTLKQNAEPQR